jgi:hypothetical protein
MAMLKRRQNQKLPKQIATPIMEGRRKEKYHVKDGEKRFRRI